MKKTIKTLIQDINNVLTEDHQFNEKNVDEFGQRLAVHIKNKLSPKERKPRLTMSQLGTPCDRKLWYKINRPQWAEKLPPQALMKFLFGDLLEELILFLAKEAGHKVEGEQDLLEIEDVRGRRDAVIDGVLIDVKSANSRSFDKFEKGLSKDNDAFGYLDQLGAYLHSSLDDPLVVDKDNAGFLVVDKELGKLKLDMHSKNDVDYKSMVNDKQAMLKKEQPPARAFTDTEDGKSGNRKLDTVCRYCEFKHNCWPNLRTFIYSNGPRYLTNVARLPNVVEIDKNGNLVDSQHTMGF